MNDQLLSPVKRIRAGTEQFELEQLLCDLYAAQPLTVDKLPYTHHFDGICQGLWDRFSETDRRKTIHNKHQVWMLLMVLRKRQVLPRKSEKRVEQGPERRKRERPVAREGGLW